MASPQQNHPIDPHLLRLLVTLTNHHIASLISNPKARKALQQRCTSRLNVHSPIDFSGHSVLSSLHRGIESVELAVRSESTSTSRLQDAEKMLQAPAMLDQNGVTGDIPNLELVCWSYFYLGVVRRLQGDEVQVAVHFLEALVVAPAVVREEMVPELYRAVVRSCIGPLLRADGGVVGLEGVMWGARSYKAWLMYQQVISYGQVSFLTTREHDDKSRRITNSKTCGTSSSNLNENVRLPPLKTHQNFEKVHPIDPQEQVLVSEKVSNERTQKCSNVKRLQDILMEDQSDSPTSLSSGSSDFADNDFEEYKDEFDRSLRTLREATHEKQPKIPILTSKAPEKVNIQGILPGSSSELDFWNSTDDDDEKEEEPTWQNFRISENDYSRGSSKKPYQREKSTDKVTFCRENSYRVEQAEILEKVISKLCFSDEDDPSMPIEITTVYETLASKSGLKYALLKDAIVAQLLMALSTSRAAAAVSILSTIVSRNPFAADELTKKGLRLGDLADALKRNVHEAVTLIYLLSPSPFEIEALGLLPALVKTLCGSSRHESGLVVVGPPSAALMIIEVLVTAFDSSTNNAHLAEICSPEVVSCLLNVPTGGCLREVIALGSILVRCMRFDGRCRKYASRFSPFSQFSPVSLVLSNEQHALFVGLDFYHELLRMPRSSSVNQLQRLREEGGFDIMCVLLLTIQQTQQEYKVLAASLLLQLDVLEESLDDTLNREVAVDALLESLTSEENAATQQLSAFVLANIGGTYAWTGEPYTVAWLVKKAGLLSLLHKNVIKNIDWSDNTLQEYGTDIWCGKVARHILRLGNPVFRALENGLKSKNRRVSKDCLAAVAWIGCEIVKGPDDLRFSACDILMGTIEQFVHPGRELEERLLACLCIYNYTFGRGMHKLVLLSEGVRESLRRLSSITWMADELLKVADFYTPNKWRISCVHTQVLEANHNGSGAVNSLVYYRGQLFGGYADGSIKAWDIKGQTATLVSEQKEHRKAVTCFSLLEPGNHLLSGSADKTIRIWQMVERKLQCIEVITTKESIQSLETFGESIFAMTHSHKMKVFDSSRKVKDLCKNKHVKCIRANQGKVYIGCMDSSIQELTIGNNRLQEVKAPSRSWRMQNKPINSIALYKDWLYSASTCVEGSRIKDWRRRSKAQISIAPEKRASVVAMSVVEDFIYLNCSSSASNLEIWLRGTQHKVGRLSAGSKITSILTANDLVLCGTETGLIKGWIPL